MLQLFLSLPVVQRPSPQAYEFAWRPSGARPLDAALATPKR